MTSMNWLKKPGMVAAVAALAWAAAPAVYAHHAGPAAHRSAVAGLPDGTPISLEGRLSILDFVYPGGAGHALRLSTRFRSLLPSSRGLGRGPLKAKTRVRIP